MATGKNREVEKYVFGGLIGVLVGALVGRLVTLGVPMTPSLLAALVASFGWGGVLVAHFRSQRSMIAFASIEQLAKGFRTLALRAVLWLLGAAAILGVITVLSGSFDLVGRVAATTLVTAIAAAVLWPALAIIDNERTRRVGMLGSAGILSAYFLVVPSIWDVGYWTDESWWVALSILVTLPIGMVAMRLTHSPANRLTGILASILYVSATFLFVTASWGSSWSHAFELVNSGIVLLGYGAAMVVALLMPDSSPRLVFGTPPFWKWWSWRSAGITAAVLAAGLCLMAIWDVELLDYEWVVNISIVSIVVAYSNVLCLIPLKGSQGTLRKISIAAAIICGIMSGIAVFESASSNGVSIFGRGALASGIVASTGLLGALILTKINQSGQVRIKVGPFTEIDANCPCCGKRQSIRFGTDSCPNCHAVFHFELKAPKVESPPHVSATPTTANTPVAPKKSEARPPAPGEIAMPFLDD